MESRFLVVTSTLYTTDYGDTLPTVNERCFTEPSKAHEHTPSTDTQVYYLDSETWFLAMTKLPAND